MQNSVREISLFDKQTGIKRLVQPTEIKFIPRNLYTAHALLCFVVV